MVRPVERENHGFVKPGQDLVVAGFAGTAGTGMIAKEQQQKLQTYFRREYVEKIQSVCNETLENCDAPFWKQAGVTEWEPVGEGGILTALWNLSAACHTGIDFYLRKIPVKQETIELCEYFELNPYRLLSENCMLLVCDNGGQTTEYLQQNGIYAKVIGRTTKGVKKEYHQEDSIACLERPVPDEVFKIIHN